MRPARVSARPRRRSASASSMTPLSEDRRPPSNAAVTFLELTDGNVKVIGGSSFIAGYLGERRNHDALATRSLCKLNALRHTERSNFVAGGIRWASASIFVLPKAALLAHTRARNNSGPLR